MQVTWLKEDHRIKRLTKRRAWIVWTHGPPHHDRPRALKKGVITVVVETSAMHLDRQITIQGERFDAFYKASQRASSERFIMDRTAAIFLKRFTMDRSIVTVDSSHRTVTPKTYINRYDLTISKAFEEEIDNMQS